MLYEVITGFRGVVPVLTQRHLVFLVFTPLILADDQRRCVVASKVYILIQNDRFGVPLTETDGGVRDISGATVNLSTKAKLSGRSGC